MDGTKEFEQRLQAISRDLPRFPDGRIDYSTAKTAPVLGIVVTCGNKLLLVKRSQKVSFYPGKWNWVSGFIDELKPLRLFALQELNEETGITADQISSVHFAPVITEEDKAIAKTWLIHPVRVVVDRELVPVLDWEADAFNWITQAELGSYDTVPGVVANIRRVIQHAKA